jgi:TolB protein
MKSHCLKLFNVSLAIVFAAAAAGICRAQDSDMIKIQKEGFALGTTKPIPVSLDGFSGVVADVLKFDLYVQGFSFVAPDAAQYQISGGNSGNVTGTVTDKLAKKALFSNAYTGTSLRRQAHAFANDIVFAVTGNKGIGLTKIAFKAQRPDRTGEIYVSDFDGNDPQPVTRDNAIVSHPSWAPGRLALYYNSYKLESPEIFSSDLTTGERKVIAAHGGSNFSPAASPDGSKVAMILDPDGWVDVYVADANGGHLKRLTKTQEDDSSPCWSPDGKWICFATKIGGRRLLAKVPADGGEVQVIRTPGAPNPTEPDWSPDGKWIAFTSQTGEFDICVMPVDGSAAPTVLVRGQNPSWSPNSRTLIFNHAIHYEETLSVLDVFTKQVKDIGRIAGSDSQPAWRKDLNF